ncbi:helix-turn-helix domain-containing protein [Cohnella terricola]|uniref:Helix-turn-helix domain-containing protein n=1 Tax=Cohnella terricola TaxID=1289167 RepID=A0A559JQP1_9BACL|nr:helix-turn-helix domain-containing protein [Cohnella terricola]TVY02177.1 helix-turn-helix domain-containing protein [Cohnella terricola]
MASDPIRIPEGFPEEKLIVLPAYLCEELSRHPLTRGLFVSDIGFFPHAANHYRERPEGSDSHIFINCLAGEGWIEQEGRITPVRPGDLVVIPAATAHRYGAAAEDPWSIYWFHLQGEHVADFVRLYGLDASHVRLPPSIWQEWTDSFERCYALLTDKPYSMPVQTHISQTIGQLLGRIGLGAGGTARDKKREADLERAIRYLNDRLDGNATLPEVAAYTGLSKQHLIHLFNQETGFSPIEYYLRMKMQKAGQLLSLTGLSVKEIAAAVGIADPYYFSRLFKKRMGVSPSDYRSTPKG